MTVTSCYQLPPRKPSLDYFMKGKPISTKEQAVSYSPSEMFCELIQTCSFVGHFYGILHNIIIPLIQVQPQTYCNLHFSSRQETALQAAFLLLLFKFKTKASITSLQWFFLCVHCNSIHKQQKMYFTQRQCACFLYVYQNQVQEL